VMTVMTWRIKKTSSVKIVTIRMAVLFWTVIKKSEMDMCWGVPGWSLASFFQIKKKKSIYSLEFGF
jgi:hypothetical protein